MYKVTENEIRKAELQGKEDARNGFTGSVWNRYGCTYPELHEAWARGNCDHVYRRYSEFDSVWRECRHCKTKERVA